MDKGADDAADGQWMTYAELGLARGISKESALKLALRRKWRKQDDNRGHVRVCVPAEWASKPDIGAASGADAGADISRAIGALEAALAMLREQLTRESARADAAEAGREVEREGRAKAEADLAALRVQLEQAQAEARQSPMVRRLLGLIARLRAEWRG